VPAEDGGGDDPFLAALVAERPLLVGLAYRITGSRVEAEDIVQDAWLRARRTDASAIDNPAAWLTTIVARLALDHLRSARHRRESYVGPWLPEPVLGALTRPTGADPAAAAELAESVTFGFLRVLEALAPVERVVFLMADVFDVPFPEIGRAVDRSPEACRQIASRARRRIRDGASRRHRVPEDAASVVGQLQDALAAGDTDRVLSLLAEDAVLVSDGGPQAHAARRPVIGRERVARFLVNAARRYSGTDVSIEWAVVNGEPSVVVTRAGRRLLTLTAHVSDGVVSAIYAVINPDKLAALDIADPMM
jgi:RNA polymerase sigma-70 factor (ECF subfamily)